MENMRSDPKTILLFTECFTPVPALDASRAEAVTQTVPITADTFIDSSAAGHVVNGTDEQSYGSDGSVKVVAANTFFFFYCSNT